MSFTYTILSCFFHSGNELGKTFSFLFRFGTFLCLRKAFLQREFFEWQAWTFIFRINLFSFMFLLVLVVVDLYICELSRNVCSQGWFTRLFFVVVWIKIMVTYFYACRLDCCFTLTQLRHWKPTHLGLTWQKLHPHKRPALRMPKTLARTIVIMFSAVQTAIACTTDPFPARAIFSTSSVTTTKCESNSAQKIKQQTKGFHICFPFCTKQVVDDFRLRLPPQAQIPFPEHFWVLCLDAVWQ